VDYSPLFTQCEPWRPPRKKKKKREGEGGWPAIEASLRRGGSVGDSAGFDGRNGGRCRLLVKEEEKLQRREARRRSHYMRCSGSCLWWIWRFSSWWRRCWRLNAAVERERKREREREREREAGSTGSRNRVREAGFFAVFGPKFLPRWSMKITYIYRWWKSNTSLLVPNFSLWFNLKIHQPLLQRSNDELLVLCRKIAGRVGHFRAVPPPLQPRSANTIYTRVYSSVSVSFSCRFHLIWGRNEASNALGRRPLGQPL